MDINNGLIYEISTRRVYAKVKDRDMSLLMSDRKFISFLLQARTYYEENKSKRYFRSKQTLGDTHNTFTIELDFEMLRRSRR